MEKIVVIGGGASGLISAINAKGKNNKVIILERYDRCGRKILVSGNGRCNYWNSDQEIKRYHSNNINFLEHVIIKENQDRVLDFFKKSGIEPYIKNGYYYPYNMQSLTIRDILLRKALENKIDIINNADVNSVVKKEKEFIVTYNNNEIVANKVIMAMGSNAYYKEENRGYNFCNKFGHNIIPTMPSLVQLICDGNYFSELKGIRCNAKVSVLVNNVKEKEEIGELLFTDYGLSGICILNLSRIASTNLSKKNKVEVSIDFLYDFKDECLEERSTEVIHNNLIDFLDGILNRKIINVILNQINFDYNKTYNSLTNEEKNQLNVILRNFRINVKNTKSLESAQVSTGGVDTKEINPLTMESLLVKNLFIIGEMLDVDGDCGGYNLGFSWISGIIAGRSVNNDKS